jgi:magnesium transporter
MLRLYAAGATAPIAESSPNPDHLRAALWIDLRDPTPEDTLAVEQALGIELPSRADMEEIEATSRVYRDGDTVVITVTQLIGFDQAQPSLVPVSFVVTPTHLVTQRFADPRSFRAVEAGCARDPIPSGPLPVLFRLLDAVVDRTADVLELMSAEIDGTAARVFGRNMPDKRLSIGDMNAILKEIGRLHFVTGKVHDSLLTLARAASYLSLPGRFPTVARDEVRALSRDIASLMETSAFNAGTVAFLMDATVGRISVEQNAIIKIFSVAAVVFLPPTLVASIYGMNFEHMPELGWTLGYPWAIGLMILSAVLPYLFFKHKGWL